jgi:hypothetical protein
MSRLERISQYKQAAGISLNNGILDAFFCCLFYAGLRYLMLFR